MAQDKESGLSKDIIKVLKELGPKDSPKKKKRKKKKKHKKEGEEEPPINPPVMVSGSF